MFSGIVETVGTIMQRQEVNGCLSFIIKPLLTFNDLNIGDSVSVNGVCLTVTTISEIGFAITAVPETLRQTNLSSLAVNTIVNLERALAATARIGGHTVQGHIDGTAEILSIDKDTNSDALLVKFSLNESLRKYLVNKGYVAIDGMSITIIEAVKDWFTVSFIPHTQTATIVQHYQPKQLVNIEVDILGKYIEKYLGEMHYAHSC